MTRCAGITKKGTQCTREAVRGRKYCRAHDPVEMQQKRRSAVFQKLRSMELNTMQDLLEVRTAIGKLKNEIVDLVVELRANEALAVGTTLRKLWDKEKSLLAGHADIIQQRKEWHKL